MWSNASTPSMPSAEELRAAYAAKQRVDAMADYASRAAAGAREGVASALASARTGASEPRDASARAGGVGASAGAGGLGERRWTCHACERLEGGGRGPTRDGTIVQPANVPMVLLEVKGEVVERCALPMGKDDLVKGEMMTIGKWLARVVGAEGATPEKPRVLVRPPEAEDEASKRAGGAVVAQHAVAQHAVAQHAPPLMIPTPSLATQPRAGGLEAPGARREYYREEHQQQYQQHPSPPQQQPRYHIYEPPPRFERAVDPDTGTRERWMGGGWRGRGSGDDRPRGVTQQEVDAARARLLELEQEARIRAEVAAAEAMARQQQAEAARLSAETALEQMSQAEAANRAVRDAEYAAAEAKRLAYFAAENQREAESQFISMLPLDGVETAVEAQRRVTELDDIQRRIAEHERAAAAHTLAPPPREVPHQYPTSVAPQAPPMVTYAPPLPQQEQQQYQPPQQQYRPPQQQQEYQPPQRQQQYQPPPQQQQQQPASTVSVRFEAPYQPPPQSAPKRAEAEIEYTTSPSNVKDRAAAFGHVTIKSKPASRPVDPVAQTYANSGTSQTSASPHALAQVMRQERPPTASQQQQQQLPSKKEETPEELRRKIALLERLARSRGLIA